MNFRTWLNSILKVPGILETNIWLRLAFGKIFKTISEKRYLEKNSEGQKHFERFEKSSDSQHEHKAELKNQHCTISKLFKSILAFSR